MKNINPTIIELLNKRGVKSEEDIAEFLSEKPQKTYDPFLLMNMEAGVDFILSRIDQGKKFCIFGDYDADGVTSIVILKTVLDEIVKNNLTSEPSEATKDESCNKGEKRYSEIQYYIPSRFNEGYGLSKAAIDKLKAENVEVILTVDCGSVSYEEVLYAKEVGLEILVTDHHTIGAKPLDCLMINPKQEECQYPFKDLAGCGVAFKVAQALQTKSGIDSKTTKKLLDVLAIGTVGDIVPLIDENRTFVKYGLNLLNQGNRNSINIMTKKIWPNKEVISSEEIAYGIVPHINAAGRMADANICVEFFVEQDQDKLEIIVDRLIEHNKHRKAEQEATYLNCLNLVEIQCKDEDFLIVKAEDAHEGITGIVAGKIKEKFNRPTVVITQSEGTLKGTSRSIESIDLYSILNKHQNLFERFGGHKGACGFSMSEDKLSLLREAMKEEIKKIYEENQNVFDKETKNDCILKCKDVTIDFIKELGKMEPFGHMNPRPKIKIEKAKLASQHPIGKDKTHAKFLVTQGQDSIDGILFSKAKEYDQIIFGSEEVSVTGTVAINKWNNREKCQITTEDIKVDKGI